MTLKSNRVRAVVNVNVHAKYHQAEHRCSRVILYTSFFAQYRNGKESKNLVL